MVRSVRRGFDSRLLRFIGCILGQVVHTRVSVTKPHPLFRLVASVSWCWSWEKEGSSSWSGLWHLVCTLEVFHVHTAQLPGPVHTARLDRVCFCLFSLGLCFVYSFVFPWFVCVSQSFYVSLGSWVISFTVFGVRVTNLNEPPRALAASTIAWVRS